MIELIYNEEGEYSTEEKVLTEPQNVKQFGEPGELKKIFVEDFVYTFLCQYAGENDGKQRISILFGKSKRGGGKRHIYIKGALAIDEVFEKQGKYFLTEKIWGQIYQDCEKYFPEQEIVGWFLSRPGLLPEKNAVIEETHRTYFSGAEKVLFMMEPMEKESAFFGFNGNRFVKQSGYYIYYEKNMPMQEYMISRNRHRKNEKEGEKPDVAIANFRKILKEKQARNVKRKKQAISYGTKIAILMVVFVAAVAVKNQTDRIEKPSISQSLKEAVNEEVVVEELPGDVEIQETMIEEEIVSLELPLTEENTEEAAVIEEEPEPAEETMTETPAYVEYIVQTGDTLAKISRDHYGTDEKLEEICSLNGITDGDYIQAGEIILLP